MNVTYDEMPKSVQKIYRFNNTLRKITMILSWVLAVVMFLAMRRHFAELYAEDPLYNLYNDWRFDLLLAHFSIMVTSVIHGFLHGSCIFRTVWCWLLERIGVLLILFLIIAYFVEGVIFSFFCSFGYIFTIIDTIRFLTKKPLIYRWEHKYLMDR